jgi:hypothetical protein
LLREDVAGGTAADGTCGREGEALGAVTAAAEAFLKEPSFGDGVVAGLDGGETADGLMGLALGTEGVLNAGELACCCDCGWAGFGVAGEKEESGDDADAARALLPLPLVLLLLLPPLLLESADTLAWIRATT